MTEVARVLNGVLGAVLSVAVPVMALALGALIALALAHQFGVLPRGWRAPDPYGLALLCGAFWAWRKAG